MGVSAGLGKNIKSTKYSAVRDHMLVRNSGVSFEDLSILANGKKLALEKNCERVF